MLHFLKAHRTLCWIENVPPKHYSPEWPSFPPLVACILLYPISLSLSFFWLSVASLPVDRQTNDSAVSVFALIAQPEKQHHQHQQSTVAEAAASVALLPFRLSTTTTTTTATVLYRASEHSTDVLMMASSQQQQHLSDRITEYSLI